MIWLLGPSAAEQTAREDAELADAVDEERYAKEQQAFAAEERVRVIAEWATPVGRKKRAAEYAQGIDDLICVGGLTHVARLNAIRIAIQRAVYEALHGDTEAFYSGDET